MTTLLAIGAIGVALVLITLVVGDLLDGLLHLDALDNDLFSISSLSAFIGAFGFGGALGLALSNSVAVTVVVGAILGVAAAWTAVWATRKLKTDEVSFKSDSMIGHEARVITDIPEGGYGEIRLSVGGHVRKYSARSELPVPAGTRVWVSEIVSPTAVEVRPTSDTPEPNS